jgi:GNAT superfamily N-acetyltransferase
MIRPAQERDLDAIVAFEIEIARISFRDDPIEDATLHGKRVGAAIEDDREGTFVATVGDDEVIGWTWISQRTNFLTGARYGFLRSLAVAASARGTGVAETLLQRAIAFATTHGLSEVTGKVHLKNVEMRVAYRAAGFEPEHLTMRRVLL